MTENNSPRRTRSGMILDGSRVTSVGELLGQGRATLNGVGRARLGEIIGGARAVDVIDLTENYFDIDAEDAALGNAEDVIGENNTGDLMENETNQDVIVEDNEVTVIYNSNQDVIVEDHVNIEGITEVDINVIVERNELNLDQSSTNDLNITVDLTDSPYTRHYQQVFKFPEQRQTNTTSPAPSVSCPSTSMSTFNAVSNTACSSTSASSASNVPFRGPSSVNCGICLDSQSDLEEEDHHLLSTVCGHIFCSKCLPNYINKRGLCPICRRVLQHKDFHPIYL